MLSVEEAECHQFVPRSNGEVRDHQGLHEVVGVCSVTIAVKKDIHPNTQFFDSLSFQPLTLIDELIQRGNQYAFLEDDLVVAATKRTVASTFSDSQDNNGGKGKGKRSQHNRDTE